MPDLNHIKYLTINKKDIKEPILIIGSKEYDFDKLNFLHEFKKLGYENITGIDIQSGPGVDLVLDVCNAKDIFFNKYEEYFNTVICMQTLYAVSNPFDAAENISKIMNDKATLFFSDVFIHKIHRIPQDYWRFSYDAHKVLFKTLVFDDKKVKISITRYNKLSNLEYPFPEFLKHHKNKGESSLAFFIRKINRKLFSVGLLNLSRLLPELSIFSIAYKKNE